MIRPTARKSTCTIFLDNGVERIGQDALERHAAFLDRGNNAAESGLGQHDAGCRLGDVGRGRYRDAHLRLTQRRRVVGAVAAHADGVAVLLKRLDEVDTCPPAGRRQKPRNPLGVRSSGIGPGGQTAPSSPTA